MILYCVLKRFATRIDIRITKMDRKKPSGSDGYIYGTDCGNNVTRVYLSPNSSSYIH